MGVRFVSVAAAALLGYLYFGGFLTANMMITPENWVNEIGRGIGQSIMAVRAGVTSMIGG